MKMIGIALLCILILCLGLVTLVGLEVVFESLSEGNFVGGAAVLLVSALPGLGVYGCVRGIKRLRRKEQSPEQV